MTTAGFYERVYRPAEGGERNARWRALGARVKADHVEALSDRAGLRPASVVEVGCGDGALLAELARRGFASRLAGFEIAATAAELARRRGLDVQLFDGHSIRAADGSFELGLLSHVLEHVPDPTALLRETARVCGRVLVEVPLESNLSGRRRAKRRESERIGHVQAFDRRAVERLVEEAGLLVVDALADPLPTEVHVFFAEGPAPRARAVAKGLARRAVFAVSRAAAERLFTLHYACACAPAP